MAGRDDHLRKLGDLVVGRGHFVSAGLGIIGLGGFLVAWLVDADVFAILGFFSIVLGAILWGFGSGIEARRLGATRRSASWTGMKSIGGFLFWWTP